MHAQTVYMFVTYSVSYTILLLPLYLPNLYPLLYTPIVVGKRAVPADMSLRYYSAPMHASAFVLPGKYYYCQCYRCVCVRELVFF